MSTGIYDWQMEAWTYERDRLIATDEATIRDITGNDCPLCGGRLARSWDFLADGRPRRCLSCGAAIRPGVQR